MYSQPRTLKRIAFAALSGCFRFTVLGSVCLSLWQAPVPWLHHHCKDCQFADGPLLAHHVQAMHHNSAEEETGWHFHFVMLEDILRGSGLPFPPEKNDPPILPTVNVVLADHSSGETITLNCSSLLTLAEESDAPRASSLSRQGTSPTQFSRVPLLPCRLHVLLCSARC